MYRDLKASSAGWVRKKSYCNTVGCIARGGWFKEKFVLQNLYCEVQWQETRLPVSQDRQLYREAGRLAGRGSRLGVQARGWARGRQARERQASAREARGACAAGARQARGLALGCALGLFSICFDLVFFLSHQMNNVHCKINFEKKNI